MPEPRLRRAALLGGVAEGVLATALPLLAAAVTRDPFEVATVVAAQHAPWIVVALAWPLVAAFDRRTVAGVVHTGRALVLAWLALHTLAGTDTVTRIQLVAVLVGFGEALSAGVDDEAADSRVSTRGMVGLGLLGMPLGGFLYEIFSTVPFMFDVLCFALAALFALFIPRPVGAPALSERSTRLAPGTRAVAITAFVASLSRSAVLGVLVLFALIDLGLGAPAWGLVLGGLAASTAVGGWIAPEAGAMLGLRAGFAAAAVVSGGALVAAAQVADVDRPWLSVLALGVAWAAATTGSVLLRALLPAAAGQPLTDGSLRAFHIVEWVGIVIGALAGGWLAEDRTVADVVQLAAAGWVVAAISVIAVRRRAVQAPALTLSKNWLDAA